MNSWESLRRNSMKERSSFSRGCGGMGFCEGFLREVVCPHHPQPPLVPCYDKPKRGTRTLTIYFPNKKSPPTRNRPISPKPIATNKVRAFGGQSAPPSLKRLHSCGSVRAFTWFREVCWGFSWGPCLFRIGWFVCSSRCRSCRCKGRWR